MSSISFKGKNAVWNHHLSVPYQTLEKDKKLSLKGKNEDENLIIEADNLMALKSLLPKYQGQIKCIYIDPPYNTGNENWIYNDKINSPLMAAWINKTVGVDDLTRHDKWLCMMAPRLKLLRDLLSNDGVIFISIDDNEIHHLQTLMDEIFGEENHLESFIWKSRLGKGATAQQTAKLHEYVVCYAKDITLATFKTDKRFSSNDSRERLRQWGQGDRREDRPTMYYPIESKKFGKVYPKKPDGTDGRWRMSKNKIDALIEHGLVIFEKQDDGRIEAYRIIPSGSETNTAYSSILDPEVVKTTAHGSIELKEIFGEQVFDYPKPSSLIKELISLNTFSDKNAIILDSFAGSGTTAHAVMSLSREDNGNRKFILVQLPEEIKKDTPAYKTGFRYVHEITRERVKKVIKRDKLRIGFSYMKLGPQIDADSILSGSLPTYKEFAKYTYYLSTGKTMDNEKSINETNYFVGKVDDTSIYLLYEKDQEKLKRLAITLDWAEAINKKDKGKKTVYAPACFLDEESLEKFNINFVAIPYSLFEKK